MNGQTSMFELGDTAGDERAHTTADGARVAEPSLFQQGRELTASQIAADAVAAELLERHRATLVENEHGCHFCANELCAIPNCHRGA